jgi:hypothetical protein
VRWKTLDKSIKERTRRGGRGKEKVEIGKEKEKKSKDLTQRGAETQRTQRIEDAGLPTGSG